MHGKSCILNVIESFGDMSKRIVESSALFIVSLIFSKGFDKILLGRMVHAVRSVRIQGERANLEVHMNGQGPGNCTELSQGTGT